MTENKYRPNGEYQQSKGPRSDYRRRPNSSATRTPAAEPFGFERGARSNHGRAGQWRGPYGNNLQGDENVSNAADTTSTEKRGWSKHYSPDLGSNSHRSNSSGSKEPKGDLTDGSGNQVPNVMPKYTVKRRDETASQQQQRPRYAARDSAESSPGPEQQLPQQQYSDQGPAGGEADWPSLGGGPQLQPTPSAAAVPQRISRPVRTGPVAAAVASAGGPPSSSSPGRPAHLRSAPLPPAPLRLVGPGPGCGQFSPEAALEFVEPSNTNFAVVGVLGLQGSGKSTVLNALLGDHCVRSREFEVETLDNLMENSHCTRGVQLQVTAERAFLLDCQALLALSNAEAGVQAATADRRGGGGGAGAQQTSDFVTVETGATMQGIQLTAFLMSVCHLLLVVQDGWPDPDLLRLLLTADMLRPAVLDGTGFQPRLVFVLNRAPAGAAASAATGQLRDLLRGVFESAAFRADPEDLFCLPLLDGTDAATSEFTEELERLRRLILTAPRHHMLPRELFNEKVWLEFANRVWEDIQQSVMLAEYHRLIG